MRIVFIGPPGAGKGTQSERLLSYLNIPHISTGDILRKAIEADTPEARRAKQFMDEGKLAPDEFIMNLIAERLAQPECCDGVLFDGFPRTLVQAESLDRQLAELGAPLDLVLELRVSDDLVIQRLTSRARNDDTPNVIAERLNSYWRQTRPLLDYYRKRGLLESIDGVGSPDEVFDRIREIVERRRNGKSRSEATGDLR